MKRLRNLSVLGFTFLFAVGFVVSSGEATKSDKRAKKAQPQIFIPNGDDTFETPDNGETIDDFSETPIPAGFFGPGSLPYAGTIVLKGKPLPEFGDDNIDTVITRQSGGTVPFTTSLRVKALSMESSCPITVSYQDGHTEKWDVTVGLSPSVASTGSMTIKADGKFNSTLNVYPDFSFTRHVGLNGANSAAADGVTKRLDTGSPMVQMYLQSTRKQRTNNSIDGDNGDVVIVPCPVVVDQTETVSNNSVTKKSAHAVTKRQNRLCTPPVSLGTTNSPWAICNGHFCIPRPLTEAERLAKHFAKFKKPTPRP